MSNFLKRQLPPAATVLGHAVPPPVPVREPEPEPGDQAPDDTEDFAMEE